MVFSYIFCNTGRNSSRILTKLGMMNDYGSGMMPIVGRYGPVITAVLVDWFLRLKYGVFVYFLQYRSQFKSDPYQTWYDE